MYTYVDYLKLCKHTHCSELIGEGNTPTLPKGLSQQPLLAPSQSFCASWIQFFNQYVGM